MPPRSTVRTPEPLYGWVDKRECYGSSLLAKYVGVPPSGLNDIGTNIAAPPRKRLAIHHAAARNCPCSVGRVLAPRSPIRCAQPREWNHDQYAESQGSRSSVPMGNRRESECASWVTSRRP